MCNDGPSSPTLTNVTFSGNAATINGGGMYNHVGSAPTLTNVIIWGSTGGSIFNIGSNPTISYSLLQGSGCPTGATCGSGMIYNTDPLFVDADGVDNVSGTLDDNLRLQLTSPAIDAGNNNAPGLSGITTDLDGNKRFEDIPTVPDTGNGPPPIVDMGAYEAQDTIAPTVTVNQAAAQPDPTNSAPIYFIAVFSEPISTTTFTAADVSLSGSTAPGASVVSVTQIAPNDGTTFQIAIAGMTGSGTVIASIPAGGVQDPAGNVNLASTSTDNSVTYDITAPTVVSITRADPNPTNAAGVRFTVTFSEAVIGMDASDFSLTPTGSLGGASVTGVSGAGSVYTVTVSTGTGSGTLRLDIPGGASINDPAGNSLSNLPYTSGQAYDVDKTAPGVSSISRVDPNPTSAAGVRFTVTFSEAVTGVDAGDFSLTPTGSLGGASVTGVSGAGSVYTVTVSTGTGSGTLRLDIPGTATITDLAGNGLSNLPYTSGQAYEVDRTAPGVASITRVDPNPTSAASVAFSVIFSEAVIGVDAGDFSLTPTGSLGGASVTGVSGAGSVYTVTVSTGTGSGTLRLDIPSGASITDPAGNSLSNLPYTGGQAYDVDRIASATLFLPVVLR
uniref:Bacterial Ig-like domain-containing protein n=1 Tax=Caldilinea aerophila TaxID=133453 RepID=A0A7C1FWC7_9CHLR